MEIKNIEGKVIFVSGDRVAKDRHTVTDSNILKSSDGGVNGADLTGANLRGASLVFVDFDSTNLSYADLEEASLEGSNMGNANLFRANLRNANLYSAFLNYANFQEANLESADLRGTNLIEANLRGANLTNANLGPDNMSVTTQLHNADLTGAKVDGTSFKEAEYNSSTILPEGFDPEAHGMKFINTTK